MLLQIISLAINLGGVGMSIQYLRDRNNQLMGKISEVNNKLVLRDKNGLLLGYYDKRTDKTRDRNGRLIGKGNLLTMLLCNKP